MLLFPFLAMLLVELLLILKEVELPMKLFPYLTSHEFINILHRLFPAFMNGCRCITGAFFQDSKVIREKALDELSNITKDITMKVDQISHSIQELVHTIHDRRRSERQLIDDQGEGEGEGDELTNEVENEPGKIGLIEKVLRQKEIQFANSKEGREGVLVSSMQQSLALIEDPAKLAQRMLIQKDSVNGWVLLRNVGIYLLARYFLIKGK